MSKKDNSGQKKAQKNVDSTTQIRLRDDLISINRPCFARSYGRSILPNDSAFCWAWLCKHLAKQWLNVDRMLSSFLFHHHSFVVHGVLWSHWVHTFLRLDHGSNPESCSTRTFKTGERQSHAKLEAAIYNLPQEKYDLIVGASVTKHCCLDSNVSPIVQTANVLPPFNPLPVDDEDELLFKTISKECQRECIADFIDTTGAEALASISSLFEAIRISAQKPNALKRPNFATSLFNLL